MPVEVRYALPENDQEALATLYADTWFGSDRRGESLRQMLAGTDAMVALYEQGDLVAFGHAITDDAFVAVLRDIVVAKDARGRGVGHRLVEELVDHPDLRTESTVTVVCPERLGEYYESCGFEARDGAVVCNRDGAE